MNLELKTKTYKDSFLVIHLESLRVNSMLEFDLYIDNGTELVLYRNALLPFDDKNRQSLLDNNIKYLYVSSSMKELYQRYIEDNIKDIINDDSIEEAVKASIVYDSANLLVREVLSKPTVRENIERTEQMVENTVSFILHKKSAFHNLMKVMSFDYYTYTHSVNVCTFSLALAKYIGMEDIEELNILGTGAILHDVGKTKIAESILNKKEPLTSEEIEMIKKHPQWGFELLKETDIISPAAYYPIVQHHEREDGSGYPKGVDSNEIHRFSKIVAIVDVFDAMTTRRVYRSAIDPYPALKEMFEDKKAFNRELLEEFTRLMGPESGVL